MATKDHSIVHVIFVFPLWSIQHSFASDQHEAVHVGRIIQFWYCVLIIGNVGRSNLERLHLKFGSSMTCFSSLYWKAFDLKYLFDYRIKRVLFDVIKYG